MPNWTRSQQAQSVTPVFTVPFPWTMAPPWQKVSQKARKPKEEDAEQKRETKLVCTRCGADHRNPRKHACRVCGEAGQAKQSPKAKSSQAQKS